MLTTRKAFLSSIFAILLVTGCSSTDSMLDLGAYENGTEVTQEDLQKISFNKTTADELRSILGHPQKTESMSDHQLWYYDYTKIRHFGGNVNESNVFKISNNIVVEHYTSKGRSTATGNPLVEKANGN